MMVTPKQHAEGLVARIRAYWNARGAYPDVWLRFEQTGDGDKRAGVWIVDSNMKGGMPTGFRPRSRWHV